MRRVLAAFFLSSVSIVTLPIAAAAQTAPAITYPAAPAGNVIETQFGVPVADPYRWLENDVRTDSRSRPGSTAENRGHRRLSRQHCRSATGSSSA